MRKALIATQIGAVVAFAVSAVVLCGSRSAVADNLAAPADELAMAARVDELLAERWAASGIRPAAPAGDSAFLRRLYLDLTGVVPTASAARAFLDDTHPAKRVALIETLLASPVHVTHLADVWRDLMLPRRFDPQQRAGVIGLQNWLRRQFVENRRYDRIVADLLVASGGGENGPALFYTSVGLKPEELATSTARIFLGLRLDCAQCHNHPFDRWTQQDFWGYAAFFSRLEQRSRNPAMTRLVDLDEGEVRLPGSNEIVPARYLGGDPVDPKELGTRREQLALWIVSGDNPYLARSTVNLVWAQLFGRGLVEPLDDFGQHNPPSHPRLMRELADYFIATGYDLQRLYRALCNTRAYQLSSRQGDGEAAPPELFATMAIKTLAPEQFFDSLARVSLQRPRPQQDRLADQVRLAFLAKMQTQTQTATDFELSVPQALVLLNGAELNAVVDPAAGGLLAALEAPWLDDVQRVDMIFLATLARWPRDDERSDCLELLSAATADQRQQALGDVVWALVNGAEFTLNH